MKEKLMKKVPLLFAIIAVLFVISFTAPITANAASDGALKDKYADTIPDNLALADVKTVLNIRSGPSKSYSVIGYLNKDAACYIIENASNGWVKVSSGSLTGYTLKKYLYTDDAASERAKAVGTLTAEVNASAVRLRSSASTATGSNILKSTYRGDSFTLLEDEISPSDELYVFTRVAYNGTSAYLAQKYVNIGFTFEEAVSLTATASPETTLRNAVVKKAYNYFGVPYVYGGNSLTNGVDCSGFVRELFRECGIDISQIPRNSAGMAAINLGKVVSRADIQPGDWVFYANSSGTVNHVALYVGNNQIIHASSAKGEITLGNVDYRTVVKIKSFY